MRDIKKAIFRYESLSMCIVVLVCMYMDVVIYLGGWGCLNLPDPPTKPTYKESSEPKARAFNKRGTSV